MTNYERITNTSVEEIAKWIDVLCLENEIDYCKSDCEWGEKVGYAVPEGECRKCIVRWLKEESL